MQWIDKQNYKKALLYKINLGVSVSHISSTLKQCLDSALFLLNYLQ